MLKRDLCWVGLLGAILWASEIADAREHASSASPEAPAIVRLEPGTFTYRVAGEFTRKGRSVDAPLVSVHIEYPLSIMKTQVSAADFDRCVADGGCQPRDSGPGLPDFPAVGMSWLDAAAYAEWLSRKTGQHWRLPTDEEWSFAAGSRLKDDALVLKSEGGFAERWLAKYDQESRRSAVEKAPRPFGSFGVNENGLLDIAGNVWEWTQTCYIRQTLSETGTPEGEATVNCGVHVVAGEHRSYVSDFIRDARSGGCSVGIPPANLGFRLVLDDRAGSRSLFSRLLTRIRGGTGHPGSRSWHEWPRIE